MTIAKTMKGRLIGVAAAVALVGAGSALSASPATAKAPYQRWAQVPGNFAGVVFHPYGDKFEIWDNADDLQGSYVLYRYAGTRTWRSGGRVRNKQHAFIDRNLKEGRRIYFRVFTGSRSSNVSVFRTSGR